MSYRKSTRNSRKFIGVYSINNGQFIAKLGYKGKLLTFGPFKSEEQAAHQYDIEVLKRDPNRTKLNFPNEDKERLDISKRLKALRKKFDKNFGKKELSTKQKNKDKYMRENFPPIMRNKICANQKWKCNFCQETLSDKIIIDHMVPLFLGGSNATFNLQALCPSCDRFKTSFLDHKILKPMNQEQQITHKDVLRVQKDHYCMMQCIEPPMTRKRRRVTLSNKQVQESDSDYEAEHEANDDFEADVEAESKAEDESEVEDEPLESGVKILQVKKKAKITEESEEICITVGRTLIKISHLS